MILKVQNELTNGWMYYSNVQKVETNFKYCFHTDDADVTDDPDFYNLKAVRIRTNSEGDLSKNTSFIHVVDIWVSKFSKDLLKRFASEDVYTTKIIIVYQKSEITTLAMLKTNQVYLLNDKGETIEKL